MPRYWRDPDTMDVIKSRPDAPGDPGDVIVIPVEKWRRLVEIAKSNLPWEQEEMDAIIAEVARG